MKDLTICRDQVRRTEIKERSITTNPTEFGRQAIFGPAEITNSPGALSVFERDGYRIGRA